jgi:putative transposase
MKYIRFNNPGDAHFLAFRCFKNRRFLNYNPTRSYFVRALDKARRRHQFDIWAYVIMPEHVHLLIFPRMEVYSMSAILKSIKQSVARKSINWLKGNRPEILKYLETGLEYDKYRFWQDGGGWDENVSSPGAISGMMDYIHNNPVKAGLVERPEDWYWSSVRAWVYDEEEPLRIDKESYPII